MGERWIYRKDNEAFEYDGNIVPNHYVENSLNAYHISGEAMEKENKRLRELFRRYIDMWLDNEGVHFFDCMSKEDEKKLIEIREGGE